MELIVPTLELVKEHIQEYDESKADIALTKLFTAFPRNEKLEDILLKVVTLNALYSTGIIAVNRVAEHIHELQIDHALSECDPHLVNQIAIVKIGDKTRRNYSFASKYCSWHVQNAYPIYDSYVEKLIWAYQTQYGFSVFKREDMKDYISYKKIIISFQKYYGLTDFNFKSLDQFLWMYARKYFDKD